jgi:carboxyl-terminal processing protease
MKIGKATIRGTGVALSTALLCSVVFFLTASNSRSAFASADGRHGHVSTDMPEGRLAVFDDAWETIYKRYYDPAFKDIDWNGLRSVFRRAATEARGSRQLYEVLRRMIKSLNDPHTRVYSPDEKSDWWNPRFVSVGLLIREIEGVPTVVHVEPKSAPARAGIQPGDEIESVDGVPVSQLLQQRLAFLIHSQQGKSARFRAVTTLLEGEAGSFTKLGWRGKDGRVKSDTFKRDWSERRLTFNISRREGKYLVVEIQSFTQALIFETVRALSSKLPGAQGVILDLRSNGGGDADAMSWIAALFLGEGVALGRFTDRVGATIQLTTNSKSLSAVVPPKEAKLPLIALVGERTSSAAEILASVLQTHGRARLVGTTTCGCVLAIRSRHTLPDGGVLDVSEFDYRTPSGIRLEGRGVQPEDLIILQRRDLYDKRDRALEAALYRLKALVKRGKR